MSVRDLIVGVPAPTAESLELDGLGTVYVKELSGIERDRLEKEMRDSKIDTDAPGWRARLAAIYLCDEDGDRVFSLDSNDLDILNTKPQSLLDAIIIAGNKLNKYGPKEIEQAKGNS